MDITFETTLIVGNDNNYDKRAFTVEYDPTINDFNEFALDMGEKNIKALIKNAWYDDPDEILDDYLNAVDKGNLYLVECALRDIDYEKEFARFLVNKYQTQFENMLIEKLCITDTDFKFDDKG